MLDGKTAIVTGGTTGIGAAIVRRLCREGYRVVVVDCSASSNDAATADGLDDVFHITADVSSSIECRTAVDRALERFGQIDALCNNAGVFEGVYNDDICDIDEQIWKRVISVNLTGSFLMSKYVVPIMKANNSGNIVNISSISGIVSTSTGRNAAYSASKAGVISLTRSMAVSLGKFGIRANCVCPGYIKTAMTDEIFNLFGADDLNSETTKKQALQRFGTVDEIANLVGFLFSEDASFVTGATFVADGGYTAV